MWLSYFITVKPNKFLIDSFTDVIEVVHRKCKPKTIHRLSKWEDRKNVSSIHQMPKLITLVISKILSRKILLFSNQYFGTRTLSKVKTSRHRFHVSVIFVVIDS